MQFLTYVRNLTSTSLGQVRALFIVPMIAVAFLELYIYIHSPASVPADSFLILNGALGGAAAFTGGLLGFIFGVPRSMTDGTANQNQAAGSNKVNTNLEQISDWLTKTLVGASLTTISLLPGFLHRVIVFLDAGPYKNSPGGGTLAIFIACFFGTLGFFWSYIETRTTLTRIFNGATQSE